MIGIYKITNKLNGKSYVGQSIHCGKRLDEHYKGGQFIDEVIQLEGIENFTFEILKEVMKEELSYWEDYYIIKHKTMFPDGYNKRWNCNDKIRKEIKHQINIEAEQGNCKRYFYALDYEKKIKSKLTKKQFLVYTFLLSISKWDAQTKEQHYYVYKNSFMVKDACARIGISQPTWRAAIKKLASECYIEDEENWYIIDFPATYAPLDIRLISLLLEFSIVMNNGGNLVGVYATLYRYWDYCNKNNMKCCISINQLLKLFESTYTCGAGRYYEIVLGLFYSQGLVTMKMNRKKYQGQNYTEYEIVYVNCQLPVVLQNNNYGPDDIKDIVAALETSIE